MSDREWTRRVGPLSCLIRSRPPQGLASVAHDPEWVGGELTARAHRLAAGSPRRSSSPPCVPPASPRVSWSMKREEESEGSGRKRW